MAHFAILDESNIVTRVEVINNAVVLDGDDVEQEQLGINFLISLYGAGNYKQTSYNGNIRKNYAGIGYTYDSGRNAFIAPKPYPSWTLVEDTCRWTAPVEEPDDDKVYDWNEDVYQADNNNGWEERE
jgi:hypothetical protein